MKNFIVIIFLKLNFSEEELIQNIETIVLNHKIFTVIVTQVYLLVLTMVVEENPSIYKMQSYTVEINQ